MKRLLTQAPPAVAISASKSSRPLTCCNLSVEVLSAADPSDGALSHVGPAPGQTEPPSMERLLTQAPPGCCNLSVKVLSAADPTGNAGSSRPLMSQGSVTRGNCGSTNGWAPHPSGADSAHPYTP